MNILEEDYSCHRFFLRVQAFRHHLCRNGTRFPAYRISGNTFLVDYGPASLINVSVFALSGKSAMRNVEYRLRCLQVLRTSGCYR